MALETELETYRRKLPDLRDREGEWAVIGGEQVAAVCKTYDEALQAGYERYGFGPFLVKKIEAAEMPRVLLHDLHSRCRE